MGKQNLTKLNKKQMVRIAADIEADVITNMDHERSLKGQCSRAAIIRMALVERYQNAARLKPRDTPCTR